jgi:hypothetical protein
MSDGRLTKTRIRGGIWEGVLSGYETRPTLEVVLLEQTLPGVQIEPVAGQPGHWGVRVTIPASALSEGVQTFLIRAPGEAEALAHFTIITGVAMEDDLRAEVDLLRQELDMLKRAFRRHCLSTMG